jgi:cytochrome c oxidase assembly protein subunit 11
LGAGEEVCDSGGPLIQVDMPVFFFLDNDFVDDPQMKRIDSIVLSYTFFKAKYDKDGHLVPVPVPVGGQ